MIKTILNATVASVFLFTSINATSVPDEIQLPQLEKICGEKSCESIFRTALELARNGSPQAKMIVGLMFLRGLGTTKDTEKAGMFLLRSARDRFAAAQFAVGVLYIQGEVFKQDIEEGNHWLNLAAKAGYKPAVRLVAKDKIAENEDDVGNLEQGSTDGQDDGYLVITGEPITLGDYLDFIKNNTPYGDSRTTGTRIRGLRCEQMPSHCDSHDVTTPEGYTQLYMALAPAMMFGHTICIHCGSGG